MQRIVINTCHGGFGISKEAEALYRAYKGIDQDDKDFYANFEIERNDPVLLQVIDQLGVKACDGHYAELKVVQLPDDVEWEIVEYDGKEHVAECHRTWS